MAHGFSEQDDIEGRGLDDGSAVRGRRLQTHQHVGTLPRVGW